MYTLAEIISLAEENRGFVLPIFSYSKSNLSYAQNLDIYGNIKSFIAIADSGEMRLPHTPPAISLEVGDRGVLCFIDDSDTLHIGSVEEMREKLSHIEISSPFLSIEVSSLLNNKSMHKSAITECSSYFSSERIRSSWISREKKSFSSSQIKDRPADEKKNNNRDLLIAYEEISSNFDHEKWNSIWLRLWKQGFEKRKLADLASLRIDTGRAPGRDGPALFSEILNEKFGRQYAEKAMQCLEKSGLDSDNWVQLYGMLARMISDRERMRNAAMQALRASAASKSTHKWRWLSLARRMNNETRYDDHGHQSMMSISISYLENNRGLSNDAAEVTLLPFMHYAKDHSIIYKSAFDWVTSSQRSTNAWSEIYIKLLEIDDNPQLVKAGIEWLQNLGGNVISWRQVWRRLEKYVDRKSHRELAIDWLRRARWDMGVWVIVFQELIEESDHAEKLQLREISASWINGGFGNQRNRTRMRQVHAYLDAILGDQ